MLYRFLIFSLVFISSFSLNADSDTESFVLDLNDPNFIYLGNIEITGTKYYYSRKSVTIDPKQPPNSGGLSVTVIDASENYRKINLTARAQVENPKGIFHDASVIQFSINCPSNSYSPYLIYYLQDNKVVLQHQNSSLFWTTVNRNTPMGKIMNKLINQVCP